MRPTMISPAAWTLSAAMSARISASQGWLCSSACMRSLSCCSSRGIRPAATGHAALDGEAGAINRADVAAFCLDAVLDPDFKYVRQAVCISSDKGAGFKSLMSDKTMSRMGAEPARR